MKTNEKNTDGATLAAVWPKDKPTPTPTAPAKPMSLLQRLQQAGQKFKGADVANAIVEANVVLTNTETVSTFVATIDAADALGLQKLAFNDPEGTVREWWLGLPLTEVEVKLKEWRTEGDGVAGEILASLAAYRESAVDVVGPLWRLVNEITRPAREVKTYYQLSQLMKSLLEKGLVEKSQVRGYCPPKAVVLGDNHNRIAYFPANEGGRHSQPIPMVGAGWPFIKQAEARAQEAADARQQELAEMEKQDSGLTGEQAQEGNGGTIFLRTGANSGALLEITNRRVRITKALGLKMQGPGRGALSINAGREFWPNDDLFAEFQAWLKTKAPEDTAEPPPAEATPAAE